VPSSAPPPGPGIAFLLAQLGAHAADEFARSLAPLELTPGLAGVLRLLRVEPGLSQQDLARRLGLVPSRVVALVDDLEQRGWIQRARDTGDRRVNVLTLTDAGNQAFAKVAAVARAHEARITAGLTDAERDRLRALLAALAERRELTPGVHPGYRRLH
jgi:DNA-binding MarR family transcriptional regulator